MNNKKKACSKSPSGLHHVQVFINTFTGWPQQICWIDYLQMMSFISRMDARMPATALSGFLRHWLGCSAGLITNLTRTTKTKKRDKFQENSAYRVDLVSYLSKQSNNGDMFTTCNVHVHVHLQYVACIIQGTVCTLYCMCATSRNALICLVNKMWLPIIIIIMDTYIAPVSTKSDAQSWRMNIITLVIRPKFYHS